jgi:hypothetical protein
MVFRQQYDRVIAMQRHQQKQTKGPQSLDSERPYAVRYFMKKYHLTTVQALRIIRDAGADRRLANALARSLTEPRLKH